MGDLTINPELRSVVASESNTSRKVLECSWCFCSATDLPYGSLNLSVLYHFHILFTEKLSQIVIQQPQTLLLVKSLEILGKYISFDYFCYY